jgi:hypothetical protein
MEKEWEAERDRLAEALRYVEGHLELAEDWEPSAALDAVNAHRVILGSLRCARAALAQFRTESGGA